MANTKNATVREIIIDRCLSDRRGRYFVRGLMAACNRRLEEELQLLNQTIQLLSRFEGVPHFEWLEEINSRLSSQFFMHPANQRRKL